MDKKLTFSIVTPVYNNEKYIAETIESVIGQSGDFNIEYIIVDNCSTDKTADIVRSYLKDIESGCQFQKCNHLSIKFISEKDSGMYDAIYKGFSFATGDIYAWINSDDIYLNGCFSLISKIIMSSSEVDWVKGITSYINSESTLYSVGKCNLYSREWIREGLYGPVLNFIQQDSVFWKKELWTAVNGVNVDLNLAGDFDLWRKFSEYSPLYSINAYISCFRKVINQKSENLDEYWKEIDGIDEIKKSGQRLGKKIKKFEKNRRFKKNYKMFRSVFIHRYYLITIDAFGEIEFHTGDYESLQSFL